MLAASKDVKLESLECVPREPVEPFAPPAGCLGGGGLRARVGIRGGVNLSCSTSSSSSEKGLVVVTRDGTVENGMGDSSSGLAERWGDAVVEAAEASTFFGRGGIAGFNEVSEGGYAKFGPCRGVFILGNGASSL